MAPPESRASGTRREPAVAVRRRAGASLPPAGALTRAERRRRAQARRNRVVLVLGVVLSAAIVAAWFPASELFHQRQQLASASSELRRLDEQNRSLRRQAKELETPAAVGRIAQQQYDLVAPGEEAYQVLPPSSTDASGTLSTGGSTSERSTGSRSGGARTARGAAARSEAAGTGSDGTSRSFLGRVMQTLEFWR